MGSYVLKNFTQVELIEPAVVGTRNVLSACEKAKVKKVVVVSSAGAVAVTPNRPKDRPMDEECWSDLEYCKATQVTIHMKLLLLLLKLCSLIFYSIDLISQILYVYLYIFLQGFCGKVDITI